METIYDPPFEAKFELSDLNWVFNYNNFKYKYKNADFIQNVKEIWKNLKINLMIINQFFKDFAKQKLKTKEKLIDLENYS